MDLNDADFIFALQLQEQFNRESENSYLAADSDVQEANNADRILALQLQEELNKEIDESHSQSKASNLIETTDDYAIALQFQEELNKAEGTSSQPVLPHENRKTSIIENFWELNDPNPDIHGLFLEFNASYFWNKLQGVEVRWSNRMTLCAGLCCYEGHGGLCSIRLSLPLLKLRPRKDLVETLLHEMIHAYLFVTHNNRDHDAHGPEFLKHMHRINKLTGAKITVYHNFHDEVNEYRQHWWRCNGPCRHRAPYYGIIRRAMNRAPSANDFWWEEHKMTCGGTYEKIKEPEANNVKRKSTDVLNGVEKKAKSENLTIKTFFPTSDKNQLSNQLSHHKRINGNRSPNKKHPSVKNKYPLQNIHSLGSSAEKPKGSYTTPFSGKGYILASSPLQNMNGISKKSLHFHFGHNKTTPEKRAFFNHETEFRKRKGSYISPPKKRTGPLRESNDNSLNSVSIPNISKRTDAQDLKTPLEISTFKMKAASTRTSKVKEDSLRKKSLPAGKLSTASPLNHLKKIFRDNESNKELQDRTLIDMMISKSREQKEQPSNNGSPLGKPVVLSDTSSIFEDEDTTTNTVTCPVCNQQFQNSEMNGHLDLCLSC